MRRESEDVNTKRCEDEGDIQRELIACVSCCKSIHRGSVVRLVNNSHQQTDISHRQLLRLSRERPLRHK